MTKQLTLKEELEILRGEPIQVFTGDPLDIPCIETSDPVRLCKHPVVSVHMITYNHEPYIRQAIEGVMMQKTDFEFELVIGEDCSTDKTREICFEYQKRYPDKIRVLWSHENITVKHPHPAGCNATRVSARCRGEFIAYCEGDDFWVDPLKLQKQVDVMREHPDVGMCFCKARIERVGCDCGRIWNNNKDWKAGVIDGYDFFKRFAFIIPQGGQDSGFLMTSTVMLRSSVLKKAVCRFEIFHWALHLGDAPSWLGISLLSDAFFLDEIVSTYRQVLSGACLSDGIKVDMDARLCRIWYFILAVSNEPEQYVVEAAVTFLNLWLYYINDNLSYDDLATRLNKLVSLRRWLACWQARPVLLIRRICGATKFARRLSGRYVKYVLPLFTRQTFPASFFMACDTNKQ